MDRRKFLAGVSAAALAVLGWPRNALSGFGIFQVGTGSGGAFTPTLQAIDGGPTWWNSNGFTVGVTAGYDSKIEIGKWPSYLITSSDYTTYGDLGINTAYLITSNSNQSLAGTGHAAGVYWMPDLSDPTFPTMQAIVNAAGAETVAFNTSDEPGDWNLGIGNMMKGTGLSTSNSAANCLKVSQTATGTTSNGVAQITGLSINAQNLLNTGMPVSGTNIPGGTIINSVDSVSQVTMSNAATGANLGLTFTGAQSTISDHRPFWCDQANGAFILPLSNTPNDPGLGHSTIASMYFSTVTSPSGATRKCDLLSNDFYWIAAGSDPVFLGGAGGTCGQFYALGGSPDGNVTNWNSVSGSLTIPVSFPADVPFTTSTGRNFQLGCICLLVSGGGTSAMLGTMTAYNKTTGVANLHIAQATRTYTASQNAGVNVFTGGTATFTVSGIDIFAQWIRNFQPVITATGGHIPGGTTLIFGVDALGTNAALNNRSWEFRCSANTTVVAGDTITIPQTVGSGTTSGYVCHAGMTSDQMRRVCRYGDMVDLQRGFQFGRSPAPILQFIDVNAPFQNQMNAADAITPDEQYGATWSSIMHGALRIGWFDSTFAGAGITQHSLQDGPGAFTQVIQSPNTISLYDRVRATNSLIQQLAPVIKSQFVMNYATVSPGNFIAPFPGSYFKNDGSGTVPSTPGNPVFNIDLATDNLGNNVAAFEAASKFYTGATTGIFTQNKYWIMAGYRGSGADTNKVATFTIPNTGATTVTRIYSDGVIGAASNGAGGTRFTTSRTDMLTTNVDTVLIGQTAGITVAGSNPNGTTYSATVVDATHFDVPGAFLGSLTNNGVVTMFHNIPITSNTSFTDTFTKGSDVRIYRVN